MTSQLPDLNTLEAIRQAASERGDCNTSSLANQAMWGTVEQRMLARRALRNRGLL